MSDPSASPNTVICDEWCKNVLAHSGESRFAAAADGRIHYLVWGASDASKPVLVLLHGMLGHAHWWDCIAPYFARDFKVIAIDLPGMGDSTRRERYDSETFTRDIAAVIAQESSAPVTLIGHSFGGSRALHVCAVRPELIQRAVIVDSAMLTTADGAPPRTAHGGRVYPDRDSALARFRLAPEQPVCAAMLRAHVAAHSLKVVSGGWAWKFDPQLANAQTLLEPTVFERIRVPLDIVFGERSSVTSAERATRIASAIATAHKPICIPDGHHHLMLDQPIALISALRAVLATPGPTHL